MDAWLSFVEWEDRGWRWIGVGLCRFDGGFFVVVPSDHSEKAG